MPRLSGSAQERHEPAHASAQQAPSTQKPLKHSPALLQLKPVMRLPSHRPPMHTNPPTHSALPLHEVWHLPPAQT
jgi:hypothetical protein